MLLLLSISNFQFPISNFQFSPVLLPVQGKPCPELQPQKGWGGLGFVLLQVPAGKGRLSDVPSHRYSQFTSQRSQCALGSWAQQGQQPERSGRAMPPLLGQHSSLSSACLWDPKGIFSYFSARQRGKKTPNH